MSLYDLCLQQVLSIRKHEELFAMLAQLQTKNNPLKGSRAEIWVAAATRNPAVLDWLVLNTKMTMHELIIEIFFEVMAACCIDTLNWFAANIRLEYPNLSGQSINNIVVEVIGSVVLDPSNVPKIIDLFSRAQTNFLRNDNVVVAIWMHNHGFFSRDGWANNYPWFKAKKIRLFFGDHKSIFNN